MFSLPLLGYTQQQTNKYNIRTNARPGSNALLIRHLTLTHLVSPSCLSLLHVTIVT